MFSGVRLSLSAGLLVLLQYLEQRSWGDSGTAGYEVAGSGTRMGAPGVWDWCSDVRGALECVVEACYPRRHPEEINRPCIESLLIVRMVQCQRLRRALTRCITERQRTVRPRTVSQWAAALRVDREPFELADLQREIDGAKEERTLMRREEQRARRAADFDRQMAVFVSECERRRIRPLQV